MRSLRVYWNNIVVGHIKNESGLWSFQYSKEWLSFEKNFSVSVSFPLSGNIFGDRESRSFFSNLLPESKIRDRIAKMYGFSPKNDFELLNAIGGECAGALSIVADREQDDQKKYHIQQGGYRYIDEEKLREMILLQNKRPLLIGEDGLRLSLAGTQHKLPVYISGGKIYLPIGLNASTHIIKSAIEGFDHTVENEAFCMRLGFRVGLDVPDVEIKTIKDIRVLVVARYDRRIIRKKVIRIHQEDFCQALGSPPDQKYETEGGPGLDQCFHLIGKFSCRALTDKKGLLEWIIFNQLIGNADAHAKNISLLYDEQGVFLAPFYDLLSTVVYPELSRKMAMKIGGENRFAWIKKRHWQRFAESIDVKPNSVFEILGTMKDTLKKESISLLQEFEDNGHGTNILRKIVDFVKKGAGVRS